MVRAWVFIAELVTIKLTHTTGGSAASVIASADRGLLYSPGISVHDEDVAGQVIDKFAQPIAGPFVPAAIDCH